MCRKYPCDGKCPRYIDFEAPENLKTHIFVYNNISNMHCSHSSRAVNYSYLILRSVVGLLLDSCGMRCEVPKVSIHHNTTITAPLYLKFIKRTNSSSIVPAIVL